MAPSSTDVRIAITILSAVAQIVTSFRLIYRFRIRRLWWDEAWVAFSMVCQLVLLIALWIRTDVPGMGPLNQPRQARVVAYWIVSLAFTFVLWSARMSMLFSVIRITPPMMTLRRTAYAAAVLFGLMWAALIAQKAYICARNKDWEQLAAPQCHLGTDVATLELSTDFISDVILIILPLRLLWRVSMPSGQRKLLFILFSASILITVVSIVHATYVLGASGLLEALTANIEAAISLIVANLTVVITVVYRRFIKDDDFDPTSYYTQTESTSNSRGLGPRVPLGGHMTTLRFANSETFGVESSDVPDTPVKSMHDVGLSNLGDYHGDADPFGNIWDRQKVSGETHWSERALSGIVITRETYVESGPSTS